jgi:5-dehydro-4-deoxyglucarate dehydratase
MKSVDWNSVLTGVLSYPVTPFHEDRTLNLAGFRQNLERDCREEFTAVFICCGTGEFHALATDEYRQLVQTAGEVIGNRKPWFAGVGMGPMQAKEFARVAQEAGAHGVLAMPPYLVKPSSGGLIEYYELLANECGVKVIVYQRDNAVFSLPMLSRLSEQPNIIGVKDGTGDLERFRQFTALFGNRFAWISGMPGAEMTFEAYHACGAKAISSALANFAPQHAFDFYRSTVEADHMQRLSLLKNLVIPLSQLRVRKPGYAVALIKAAMNLMGMAAGPVRPPLEDVDEADRRELALVLKKNGLLQP